MTTPPRDLEVAALRRHAHQLRRLARQLVRDEHEAEDLVQSTWTRLLERPPRDTSAGLGGWLSRVLTNFARQRARSARSARLEELAAEPVSGDPGGAELAATLEVHGRVTDAVLALPEPYRTTVHLIFLQDLSAREVARRQGVPVETVRTRAKRALRQLRGQLDAAYAGRRAAWRAALLPLTGWGVERGGTLAASASSAKATGLGVLTMSTALKTSLVAVALLLCVIVAWKEGGSLFVPSTPAPESVARPDAATPPVEASAEPRPPGEARVAAARGPGATPAPAATALGAGDPRLTGTVTVLERAGSELTELDGHFLLRRVGRESGKPIEVEVRAGHFALELPDHRDVLVSGMVLGGRVAYPTVERHSRPQLGGLALTARWVPRTTLRVLDAGSRADLAQLTVLSDLRGSGSSAHPGDHRPEHVCLGDARSPLELPARDGVHGYWVGAPGYAWGFVRVDHRSGGERELALSPGGALVVQIANPRPELRLHLRLYSGDEAPEGYRTGYLVDVEPDGGVCRLDGLAEGAYLIAAEVGLWSDPALVLAEETAGVRAGEATEVQLTLDDEALGAPPVPFRGTLHLAQPHGPSVSLLVKRVGGPRLREGDQSVVRHEELEAAGDGRTFAWDAGQVSPGRYLVRVDPLQVARFFDVGPDGETQARVDVGELTEVEVRVVERPSGETLLLDSIAWSRGTPREAGVWQLESVDRAATEETFHLVVPTGLLGLSAHSPLHGGGSKWVELGPGRHTLELEMRRLESLEVVFQDGETRVPWDWSMRVRAERIGGDGEGRVGGERGGVLTVVVPEPGPWRLAFSDIAGFEPIEPVEVVVRAGETERVQVALERER